MADEQLTRIIKLDVNATQGLRELEKLNKTTKDVEGSVSQLTKGFDSLKNVVSVVGAAFGIFKGVKLFTDATDQIKNLEGSFTALLGSAERSQVMMGKLFQTVQTTGGNLDDVGKSMQRLAVAFGEVGGTEAQIAQVSENFIKLARIGGSSMNDATEGLRQFGQSLASGSLQGDELRSILERVPKVAQEIAREMNIPVGQLKKMGAEGKITADILGNALLRNTEEIAKQFESMPVTTEQAWNKVVSAGTQTLASLDSMMGISKTIAILFQTIGNLLEDMNGELKGAESETSALGTAATALGNAFKGVVIVVGALSGAIAAVFTSTQAMVRAFLAIGQGNFKEAFDIGKEAVGNMKKIAVETGNFMHNVAMSEQPIKKAAKNTNDWADGWDKVTKKMKENAAEQDKNKNKKSKAPDLSEWEQWLKTLKKMGEEADLIPDKIAKLKEIIENTDTSTEKGRLRLKAYQEALESLQPPTPVQKALKELTDTIDELAAQPEILKALEQQMADLVAVGAEGTREYKETEKAIRKMKAAMDDTGSEKMVQEIEDAIKAGKDLQAQIDAINKAVDEGRVPAAWGENKKNELLKVDDAAKKTKENVKSIGDQFAEVGKKFTEDFADELVDGLGKSEIAIDEWAENFLKAIAKILVNQAFQNFLKAIAAMNTGGSGFFSSFMAAPKAMGAAWNESRVEYMAQGGILNSPMLFRSGQQLAVAGEAGPEAVVPLQRTSSGNLGVAASPVNVVINNNAAQTTEVKTASSDNADGSKQITVFIEQKVRSMFSSGQMDRTMSSSYGLTRQPR